MVLLIVYLPVLSMNTKLCSVFCLGFLFFNLRVYCYRLILIIRVYDFINVENASYFICLLIDYFKHDWGDERDFYRFTCFYEDI